MKKQLLLLAAGLMLGSAAADAAWVTGKDYYFDPSACSWYNNSNAVTVITYDGNSVVAEKQADGVCKFTLTVAPTGSVEIQRKENATATTVWNRISVNAPSNDSQNLIKSNSNFNGYTWETYTATVVTGTWSTTKDYYFVSSACGWATSDGAEFKVWNGNSEDAMTLVKAGVYKFRLTNAGDSDGYIDIRRCQPSTGTVWNHFSVAATDDASQNQITCNGEFNGYTWGVYDADAPEPEGITIYWDNSVAKWATPYVHYWGASESAWPGVAMTKVEGDVWTYELPAGTTGMLFNAGDGDATKTGDMTPVNDHIYNQSGDQGEYTGNIPGPGPEPGTDYKGWYLNVIGSNFKDADVPGVELSEDGTATVKSVPVGKGTFEIKIWDGSADHYYSNGGAVALGEWTALPVSQMTQMTIQGASEDSVYDIAWNEADHAVYVTLVGGTIPDDPQPGNNYEGWYLNVIGTDGNLVPGVELAEDGTAKALDVHIGTGTFEIKIWNGTEDLYYSNGSEVTPGEWVVLPFSSSVQMTVAGAEENDLYSVEWNQKTTSVKVVKTGTVGVEAVEAAEEAVYFTLQGVKVANPENGLYIKVVNGKATKVLVK